MSPVLMTELACRCVGRRRFIASVTIYLRHLDGTPSLIEHGKFGKQLTERQKVLRHIVFSKTQPPGAAVCLH